MPEPVEATGKTVEDAIDEALRRLGATEDEVEIRVLDEGGVGGGARVLARMRDERGDEDAIDTDLDGEPGPHAEISPEDLARQADVAEDFLNGLLDRMDVDADVDLVVTPQGITAELSGDDAGLLIGRRGSTIDAIQDVTQTVIRARTDLWPHVVVDAEGYRARRRDQLSRKARMLADKVRRSGKPVEMPAMTSVERKIVHQALSQAGGVRTESSGEGPDRHIIIYPA